MRTEPTYRRRTTLLLLTLLALAAVIAPAAGGPLPQVWTWQPPVNMSRRFAPLITMVREKVTPNAEEIADRVCQTIRRRNLRGSEICIVLQNFGVGDGDPTRRRDTLPALFNHHLDALPAQAAASAAWWRTPWMENGIAESSRWMQRFIDRYRANQARDAGLPDPARFHFDSEEAPTAARKGSVVLFDAMQRDARFDQVPIPGYGQRTLKALYDAAGAPPIDPAQKFSHPSNRAFTSWYGGVCCQASDAAMNAAAYSLIRRAWPECLSSNFATSDRYDGVDGRFRRNTRHQWLRAVTRPSADLSAPILYFGYRLRKDGESPADATVRWATEQLDASVLSFGGPHTDVVPWTYPVGYREEKEIADEHLVARLLGLLRSRNVNEMILWSDNTTQTSPGAWDQTARVVTEVWSMTPRQLSVPAGELTMTDGYRLLHAFDGGATVTSVPPTAPEENHVVTVTIRFRSTLTRWANDRDLRLVIGGALDAEGSVESVVRIRNKVTGEFGADIPIACGPRLIDVSVNPGPTPILPIGDLELQLEFVSAQPFSLTFDWLQAFPVARPSAFVPSPHS